MSTPIAKNVDPDAPVDDLGHDPDVVRTKHEKDAGKAAASQPDPGDDKTPGPGEHDSDPYPQIGKEPLPDDREEDGQMGEDEPPNE